MLSQSRGAGPELCEIEALIYPITLSIDMQTLASCFCASKGSSVGGAPALLGPLVAVRTVRH